MTKRQRALPFSPPRRAPPLIARRAIHLYGAMGFTDECDIGLYLKRAINLGGMLGQAEQLRRQFVIEERAA